MVIDARPLSHPQPGGFKTYVKALVTGLRQQSEFGALNERVLLYVDRPLSPELSDLLPQGSEVRILSSGRIVTDLLLFGRQLRLDSPDLVMGTANYLPLNYSRSLPQVVTIHDAMGIKRYPFVRVDPSPKQRFINWYWETMTRLSAFRAQRVITVSQSASAELRECISAVAPDKTSVVYNGVTLPEPNGSVRRASNVILALASPDPRKNLALLYASLRDRRSQFEDRAITLEVVCTSETSRSRSEEAMRTHGIRNYRLLLSPSDQELSDAYARATVFAWPSRREGFGMPPVEAMFCGCPVVSSSAPAMPEVLGDSARYFDDLDNPAQLADALIEVLDDNALQARMGQIGRKHASRFTCARMASETQAVWRKAVSA